MNKKGSQKYTHLYQKTIHNCDKVITRGAGVRRNYFQKALAKAANRHNYKMHGCAFIGTMNITGLDRAGVNQLAVVEGISAMLIFTMDVRGEWHAHIAAGWKRPPIRYCTVINGIDKGNVRELCRRREDGYR